MLTSVLPFAVFLALVVGGVLLQGFLMMLGARWMRIARVTFRRATLAALLSNLLAAAVVAAMQLIPNREAIGVLAYIEIGVQLLAAWTLVALLFRTSLIRAVGAWLPGILAGAAGLLVVMLVVRPYLFEMLSMQSRCMSPNLGPGDRFLVNKVVAPRRWDVVAFRPPSDPGNRWAMRIVGLPGETVILRDGAVWIDGQRIAPPESSGGLKYAAAPAGKWREPWASAARPATLGPGEYFVLGDRTEISFDSRCWTGPGPRPYALPAGNVEGVATHIYWPPSRWRMLP